MTAATRGPAHLDIDGGIAHKRADCPLFTDAVYVGTACDGEMVGFTWCAHCGGDTFSERTRCGTCDNEHDSADAMTLWRAGWCRYLEAGVYTWVCDECEPKSFIKRLTEAQAWAAAERMRESVSSPRTSVISEDITK